MKVLSNAKTTSVSQSTQSNTNVNGATTVDASTVSYYEFTLDADVLFTVLNLTAGTSITFVLTGNYTPSFSVGGVIQWNNPLSSINGYTIYNITNTGSVYVGEWHRTGTMEPLTAETDPTVPSWAKQANKPNYTADEVGADASGTAASAVSSHDISGTAHSDIRSTLSTKADLVDGTVPTNQLPSYVDDVLEYATFSSLPATGVAGKIYVTLDTNLTYRWGGSDYVEISQSLALGETSATAYRGDRGKTAYDHSQSAHAPADAEKNVQSNWNVSDNTSDAYIVNKPTSMTPTAHKASHATGGNDALTAEDIGAEVSGAVAAHNTANDAHSDIRTALAAKANTSSLATVATSGSYNDLSNKPTIPTLWSGTQTAYNALGTYDANTLYLIIG